MGSVGDKDHLIFQKHLEDNNVFPVFKIVKNIPSHTASILIEKDGKNRIIIDPRASYHIDKNLIDMNENLFEKSNIILLPSPVKNIERLKVLIKKVDYLILNEIQLAKISGKSTNSLDEIEIACDEIKNGTKNIIVFSLLLII